MIIPIHPNIRKYLLTRAQAINDDDLVKILTKENITKTDLDRVKKKFNIKNYGIFFSSIIPEEKEDLSRFRAHNKPSLWVQSQIQRILDSREQHIDILKSLEETYVDYKTTPLSTLKISQKTDPKDAAHKVRTFFEKIFDISRITTATQFFNHVALFIENQGILVFSTTINTYENDFSGCAVMKSPYPLILVHGSSPARENFTLLHELGHLLLDSSNSEIDFRLQENLYDKEEQGEERWCNSFAAHFLLHKDLETDYSDFSSIEKIGKKYFSSIPAVIYHLYNQNILDEQEKKSLLETYDEKNASRESSGGQASPYQNLLSNSISNSQLLLYAQQNGVIDKRSLYQSWAGNVYEIPKVFQQLIDRSYLWKRN